MTGWRNRLTSQSVRADERGHPVFAGYRAGLPWVHDLSPKCVRGQAVTDRQRESSCASRSIVARPSAMLRSRSGAACW